MNVPCTQGALSLVEGDREKQREQINTVSVESTCLTGSGPPCVKAYKLENAGPQRKHKSSIRPEGCHCLQ